MAVFVPFTAPGDRVRCRLVKVHKRYAEAELVAIIEPSSARRQPPCPLFGQCGGCQWQQLPYAAQADWKEKIFAELMTRAGLCPIEKLAPIAAARDEWRYRSRVQFKCHLTDQGLVIGFYRPGSHFVVDVETCLLLAPPIQATLEVMRQEFVSAPFPECIPQIDVACGDDGAVRIVVHALPKAAELLRPWLRDLALARGFSMCLQTGRKETLEILASFAPLAVHIDSPRLTLRYSPGGFAQVNLAQNRSLVASMVDLLDLRGHETILDLFCGMGNLSLPLARRAGEVLGVEDYPPAIDDARANAIGNAIDNISFRVGDASSAANELAAGSFELAVLDPPRTGSYLAARELLRLAPRRILYISCDPATLVRDLKPMVHAGYQVAASQAFDFFPQTWHIESMTLLEKQSAPNRS